MNAENLIRYKGVYRELYLQSSTPNAFISCSRTYIRMTTMTTLRLVTNQNGTRALAILSPLIGLSRMIAVWAFCEVFCEADMFRFKQKASYNKQLVPNISKRFLDEQYMQKTHVIFPFSWIEFQLDDNLRARPACGQASIYTSKHLEKVWPNNSYFG